MVADRKILVSLIKCWGGAWDFWTESLENDNFTPVLIVALLDRQLLANHVSSSEDYLQNF